MLQWGPRYGRQCQAPYDALLCKTEKLSITSTMPHMPSAKQRVACLNCKRRCWVEMHSVRRTMTWNRLHKHISCQTQRLWILGEEWSPPPSHPPDPPPQLPPWPAYTPPYHKLLTAQLQGYENKVERDRGRESKREGETWLCSEWKTLQNRWTCLLSWDVARFNSSNWWVVLFLMNCCFLVSIQKLLLLKMKARCSPPPLPLKPPSPGPSLSPISRPPRRRRLFWLPTNDFVGVTVTIVMDWGRLIPEDLDKQICKIHDDHIMVSN